MRVLLVDNHDSYTYNLFQLIARVLGRTPEVLTNDDARWDGFDTSDVDAVVVSPGPGRPHNPRDLGRVPDLLAHTGVPVLGVCLGHQAIALLAGADVASAPEPRHGHLSRVRHTGRGLFAGLPQDFTAVRYHSLAVRGPLPPTLTATAWAEDGVVMGLEHRDLPRWGVQFHPESVAGDFGAELVGAFLDLARAHNSGQRPAGPDRPPAESGPRQLSFGPRDSAPHESTPGPLASGPALHDPVSGPHESAAGRHGPASARGAAAESVDPAPNGRSGLRAPVPRTLELPVAVDAEAAFARLYGDAEYAFWLDSSRPQGPARFSYLGRATGEVLTYRVGEPGVRVRSADGTEHQEAGSVFDALERRTPPPAPSALPFDFTGGYVGYFGYELKADCGGAAVHTAPTPDAVWMRCDRFVAVDHRLGRTHIVCADDAPDGDAWLRRTRDALIGLAPLPGPAPASPRADLAGLLERPRQAYVDDVKECLGHLTAGESYEICLTNRVRLPDPDGDDLDFYRRMRAVSPAPYAALLRLGGVSVLSASPERFLRVDGDGVAESRPIKGTAPRHGDPDADARAAEELRTGAKTRAENLMIVDLLRNDLGRVCEIGTVEVPAFMYTESYATVHQLVSTVRGRLRADVSAVGAVRACFPGGSMTGAPKLRTMEIIDRLESSARGIYSGALGYLSHSGTADLSIVIRTAVRAGGELSIGAGGAIVLDSDPEEEYAEMLLKAEVPARGR
ncbi:aminodeoxychorismate synthase component I [Nocardiopsis sp. NRRL B-16309]|uniref:aminodeoxychorismate synthase component I n=1 Tax=Nocardiopsis sp. NRRL B-16309 TaxID=1519494 RepID=UPI0006AF3DD2|nr:aminodeoxychorismate synthase component I [Nocardiopsis sp. NRRL B-16309]KOX15702.1 anthranilate synthase [Nocardiopsis sp. NRRL B-16309]